MTGPELLQDMTGSIPDVSTEKQRLPNTQRKVSMWATVSFTLRCEFIELTIVSDSTVLKQYESRARGFANSQMNTVPRR